VGNPLKKRPDTRIKNPAPQFSQRSVVFRMIRVADAKEVGVGNPAEETYRYPNQITKGKLHLTRISCQ